jgi:two-component system, cell cycle sensor histidine kinase and response regulator CckA
MSADAEHAERFTEPHPTQGESQAGHVSQTSERSTLFSQMQRLEEQYRVVTESLPDAVYIVDAAGRITFANAALERLTGYPRGELLGQSSMIFYEPSLAPLFAERRRRALRGEAVPPHLDAEIVRKDGGRLLAELSVANLVLEGRIVGRIGIIRDVTERRHLAARLSQVQKTEALGRLAGGIAHDFNNLLQVILGYGEILSHRLSPKHPLARHTQEVVKAAERAAALTQQLLLFSRQQTLQLQPVDINAVIGAMEMMLRRLTGEAIVLITKLSPSLGYIKADPGKLEQVLLNLAVNACDAMPQGGQLTIETTHLEASGMSVPQSLNRLPGRYVRLIVRDTGCGMDADTQSHLFEPFFTTKGPGKATGLSLATVYGIVTQSGGYITVESAPGQGTMFMLDFPEFADEARDGGTVEMPSGVPAGAETILVVEDEAPVRKLLCEALHLAGYTILEASHGVEALHLSAQHDGPIHLLVTDVVMPGMRGPEVAQRLTSADPAMKVLFISGYAPDAMPHQDRLDPEVAFLQKPFTPDELAHKVREILDAPRT